MANNLRLYTSFHSILHKNFLQNFMLLCHSVQKLRKKQEHILGGCLFFQACTEMVMPMTCSNESMFPPSSYDYKEFAENCRTKYGVMPRPHWITTAYGGYVS